MQPFSGITQVHFENLVFSWAPSFSHWLMLSAWRGWMELITGVVFCWCGGKSLGWGCLGLTAVLAFYLPCDLDWGFGVSGPQCPHLENEEVRMTASLWSFYDSWYGGTCCLWLTLLAEGEGRREEGLWRAYSLKDPGEDLNIQQLCKWIWWQ